jgi:anti-sigma factor RsiW
MRHHKAMAIVGCPIDVDETAEAYLRGSLPEQQSTAFENHFLDCPRCSERLQFTLDFIEAMRKAAVRLNTKVVAASA